MIEFKNVSFRYAEQKKYSIQNINIKIKSGQIALVCGTSGSGKTTLTKLINGLIPNYYNGELNGTVCINGIEVNKIPLYETAKYVGSVFQNPKTQFFTIDTTSELAFCLENFGLPEKEIEDRILKVSNELSIENLMGRNIFNLSGGEKQKIACSCVFVSGQEIIVLDEPSSNLDISATMELRKLIKLWKEQGKTVVISEHRIYYLKGLIDKVIHLKDGNIYGEYTEEEFNKFMEKDKWKAGLRPLDLNTFPFFLNNEVKCESQFTISDMLYSYRKGGYILKIGEIELPKNKIIGIIGHNGAGKSTFADCLCGIRKNDKSVISYEGRLYYKKKKFKLCFLVMQDVNHQLFTESVEDEMLLSMTQIDKNKLYNILKELNLYSLKNNHPMSLSGGEKQRVAIASALVSNRDFIILDEPTSGLDLFHMRMVADELKKLKSRGKSIFLITHDYEMLLSSCDYILHLEDGKVKDRYFLDGEGIKKIKKYFIREEVSL